MKPRQWRSAYKSLLLSTIIITSCLYSLKAHALEWTVVTSEANSGAGTLRDAINAVNAGGTTAPNAIAFANNVHTITLQSNLPAVTNPVLIDGLAIANVANPQNTVEGDCSLLPSPVEEPQIFSASIRVTIDGSGIPNGIDSNDRWGLRVEADTIINGIRIKNIIAPANGSRAVGILVSDNSTNSLVECCEVDHVKNTAQPSLSGSSEQYNRAVGIEDETTSGSASSIIGVSKCYIHNIKGGSLLTCEGSSSTLESGNAYGILNGKLIDTSRIECVTSGSINVSCNYNSRATVGRSVGIAYALEQPESPPFWPCTRTFSTKAGVDNCPVSCDQGDPLDSVCIQDSLVCNIFGGSVITDQQEILLAEVAGILLGSPFNNNNLDNTTLLQNNTVKLIQSGNVTSSGDNATSIASGAFGVIVATTNPITVTINCNTINNVKTGLTLLEGAESYALPGYTYGIWHESGPSSSSVQCNSVSDICGATATVTGYCSQVNDYECPHTFTRHTPGGITCADNNLPTVAGIIISNNESDLVSINNNEVENIRGGKRTAHAEGANARSLSTAGIYGDNLFSITADHNNITSVIGTELIAQSGSLDVIKQEGTTGLCLIGNTITATNNKINFVCEGRIQAAHNSLGVNLTDIFFELPPQSHTLTAKQLQEESARPYAPVITSGIALSIAQLPLFRSCNNNELDNQSFVANNTVDTVIGSAVTGGIQPLGSIATGLWIQPISFDVGLSCAEANQNGIACNNSINNIIGGTHAPSYGIFLDGSAQFFGIDNPPNKIRESAFFALNQNTITSVRGSKNLPVFDMNLSAANSICLGSEPYLETTAFPFLPFEPTSGIYTLFGGCSTLSNNTIKEIRALNANARGITTAASSDMNIFDNTISDTKGYGIFVGGAVVFDELLPGTDANPTLEDLASLRNKIYNNSTFDNTNKGIYLGLIDWNNALFGIENLAVCPVIRSHACSDTTPENSTSICGNHGQVAPCITNIICNSNGTVTIDAALKNSLPLTQFIIQFFRNGLYNVTHGEQYISEFDDPQLVFQTDFNGNAQARFTFMPLAKIKAGDTISAHVTVAEDILSPSGNDYFGDTSEFSDNAQKTTCPIPGLMQKPTKPNNLGFANVLMRAPKGNGISV